MAYAKLRGVKNYITPEGAAALKTELKKLLYADRPELVKTVAWAASNGDRSENGDYLYGKRKLREIDRRIRFLQKRLEAAEVVEKPGDASKVLFGAKVTLLDEEERKRSYRIVGVDEANPAQGSISWISPLAKALLNKKIGDVVNFKSPKGEEELEIVGVDYDC